MEGIGRGASGRGCRSCCVRRTQRRGIEDVVGPGQGGRVHCSGPRPAIERWAGLRYQGPGCFELGLGALITSESAAGAFVSWPWLGGAFY